MARSITVRIGADISELVSKLRLGSNEVRRFGGTVEDERRAAERPVRVSADVTDLQARMREGGEAVSAFNGQIEHHRQVIARLEDQIRRTGDVSLFRDLDRSRNILQRFEKLGPPAAEGFSTQFVGRLGPLMASMPISGPMAIAVGVAAAALAPTLGAALSGAVIGSAAVGGIVGGLALAARDARVAQYASDVRDEIGDQLRDAAAPFIPGALQALGDVRRAMAQADDDFRSIFADSAEYLRPLTAGALAGFSAGVAGIRDAVGAASPVMGQLGNSLERIGEAIGNSFSTLSQDARSGASALDDLTTVLVNVIQVMTTSVHALAQLKAASDSLDVGIDKARHGLEKFWRENISTRGALDLTADGFKAGSKEAEAYHRAQIGTATAADYALLKQHGLAAGLSKSELALLDVAGAAQNAKNATDALKEAQGRLESAYDSLAPAQGFNRALSDGLRRAYDMTTGSVIRGIEAAERYEASLDSLGDAVRGNGRSLDIHTKAGRANRDALQAVITASTEMYFADLQAGVGLDVAARKHERRTDRVRKEAAQVNLNRGQTEAMIRTYGKIPATKSTELRLVEGIDRIFGALVDVYLWQRALATGRTINQVRGGFQGDPRAFRRAHGGPVPGHSPHDHADNIPVLATAGEYVVRRSSARRLGRTKLDYLNRYGELPRYATGGFVEAPVERRQWRMPIDWTDTYVMPRSVARTRVVPSFGAWPPSPSAQRGDSGVWRSVVALIRSSGIRQGSFGNAYRHGDPLWHGCVPMETLVLTRRGWTAHEDVRVGEDETVGYNPATGRAEWTRIVGMHHYTAAELWTIQDDTERWEAEVTPGHKWLTDRGLVETRDLTDTDRVRTATPLDPTAAGHGLADADQAVTGIRRVASRSAAVFCPTTTLGTWTAQQGARVFLTGNSGRAVDWMGYNMDRLATFLASKRPLELIHRTNRRDYAYSRGRNFGSFDNATMDAHRNHIHIAMANGGVIGEPVVGVGRSGATYSFGETGPEVVTPVHRYSPAASAPTISINLQLSNHGAIGSRHELQTWLAESLDNLRRQGRLPVLTN